LNDEIAHLKGDQGKHDIILRRIKTGSDLSSEANTTTHFLTKTGQGNCRHPDRIVDAGQPNDVRGQGEYDMAPGIRALILILKSEGNLSEKRILGFFQNFGIGCIAYIYFSTMDRWLRTFSPGKKESFLG
jgi:hypothetical protein